MQADKERATKSTTASAGYAGKATKDNSKINDKNNSQKDIPLLLVARLELDSQRYTM